MYKITFPILFSFGIIFSMIKTISDKKEKDPLRIYDTYLNLSEATASIGDLLFVGFNMGFIFNTLLILIFILREVK